MTPASPAAPAAHATRSLADWLRAMHVRAQRLERDGWDINMLQLLHDDAAALSVQSALEAPDLHPRIHALELQLHSYVDEQSVPHPPQSGQLLRALRALAQDASRTQPAPSVAAPPAAPEPMRYHADNTDGVIELNADMRAELAAAFPRSAPTSVMNMSRAPDVQHGLFFDDSEFTSQQLGAALQPSYRIFHFSEDNAAINQEAALIEADGHMLSTFTTLESVLDALAVEVPPLLILDPTLLKHGATILAAAQEGRDTPVNLRILTFCAATDPQQQLAAIRAEVDVMIVLPAAIEQVLQRMRHALSEAEAPRVMIVQDDNIQLLLTEDILGEAGMRPLTIAKPFTALAALESFKPDLILIDLHHAECDAVELVQMIRARLEFLLTPIVFLSSDNDPGRRLRALAAGSDDYITGPISSRLLVAEVTARLLRARQLMQRMGA